MQAEDVGSVPLVSIMMPAYNAEKTIGYALASLVAQTYRNWECVVVDDGSKDETATVVNRIPDPRIRLIRLPSNQGRGVARQKALDTVKGEFLGMLDADDWVYPDKLEKQIQAFRAFPEAALVGIGIAISDRSNEIIGVRCVGSGILKQYIKPGEVPVAHASSLIRASCIGEHRYNPAYRLAQDVDFLRRFLMGRYYVAIPDVGYCYSEITSVRTGKVLWGYFYGMRGYLQFFGKFPLTSAIRVIEQLLKCLTFSLISALGGAPLLIRKRSKKPSAGEVVQFHSARARVDTVYRGVSGVLAIAAPAVS